MSNPATPVSPPRFAFAAWLFLRLLALVHLVAFLSAWVQIDGLIGPRGVLPAGRYFTAVREHLGSTGAAFAQLPSLAWWFGTETFFHVLCGAGVALAALLFAGIAPALCLGLLWAAYLSLSCAGQIFFGFQWDALLLETTLLAVLLAPWSWLPLWRPHEPPRLARLLLIWLLFRLMFLSGIVKLTSGDPFWRGLTALTVHYETQPLPTPLAWFVHQLPVAWHRGACAGMFVIELIAPFLLFAPRALRHNAALLFLALMAMIALTGNYTFFNLLTAALCVLALDDAFWSRLLPAMCAVSRFASAPGPRWRERVIAPVALGVVVYTAVQAMPSVWPRAERGPGFDTVAKHVAPFRSLNNYGLFAVMTHPRRELVFEGSTDGRTWQAYAFPHKPGALDRRPTWVAPHQPRLDWQLWFAALGAPQHNPWVLAVCEHLLRGTPEVLALLDENPFAAQPPRFVRVVRYDYRFTDAAVRANTGQWWDRTPVDFYVPSASLRGP